jgi:hypothetical protein
LALLLAQFVRGRGRIDLDVARRDPVEAVEADTDVKVEPVSANVIPSGCSIAACYDRSSSPPRLLVADGASAGRLAFSVLHEYAHHVLPHCDDVADVLYEAAEPGWLEERVCDRFAAHVLLPDADTERHLNGGVTADAVRNLRRGSSASREACCIAAAAALTSPGYVMLLDAAGTALFTAVSGDLHPIARGAQQTTDVLTRARAAGHASGRGQALSSHGIAGTELLVDAVHDSDAYTYAVWVTDSPAWGGLTVGRREGPSGLRGYCDHCSAEFEVYAAPCPTCGEARCPTCGACSCPTRPVVGERLCERCFIIKPAVTFPGPEPVCDEH